MTGKQQKTKASMEEFMKQVDITVEERSKIIDGAVSEIHAANADMLDKMGISLAVFRGGYLLDTFYSQVTELANQRVQEALSKKVADFQTSEELKRRK